MVLGLHGEIVTYLNCGYYNHNVIVPIFIDIIIKFTQL